MLTAVPFDPIHFEFCQFDGPFADLASREDGATLAKASKEAITFLDADSNVVAIIGAIETHKGCAYLWAFFGTGACRHLLQITRHVRAWVPLLGMIRAECTVLKNFKPGHRWMRLLGFKRETTRPMKRWDGVNDFHLYARVS